MSRSRLEKVAPRLKNAAPPPAGFWNSVFVGAELRHRVEKARAPENTPGESSFWAGVIKAEPLGITPTRAEAGPVKLSENAFALPPRDADKLAAAINAAIKPLADKVAEIERRLSPQSRFSDANVELKRTR